MSKKAEAVPEKLEEALKELEFVVQKLEKPDLALEDSISLFERGSKLSELCYTKLQEAEKKVEILVKKSPLASSRKDFETEEFEA